MFLFLNRAFYEMMEALNPNKNMASNKKNNAVTTQARTQHNVSAQARTQHVATTHVKGPVIPHTQHNNASCVNTELGKVKKKKEFVSKAPLLESTLTHVLVPSKKEDVRVGSLVFVKVKGKFIQHKVAETDFKKGFKVTRKGHSNGWTKHVFKKVENTKTVQTEIPVSTL